MDFFTDKESWFELFNTGPICVVKYKNLVGEWPIVEVTGNIKTLTGWDEHVFTSGAKNIADIMHKDDLAWISAEEEEWIEGNYEDNDIVNYRIITKSGDVRYVCEYAQPVVGKDGEAEFIVGYILDVTSVQDEKLKKARREVEATKKLLDEAVGAMAQGLVICDENLILHANARAAQLLDIPHEYFESGRRWIDFVEYASTRGDYGKERDKSAAIDGFVQKMLGKTSCSTIRNIGENRYIREDVQPRSRGGFVVTYTDITEEHRKQLEIETARKLAQNADKAKSEFLANMSHEIRTPMNGVLGMAELLARTELDPKQQTFTDVIVKSGTSLLSIINDILDFSKIDAGQMQLDPAPFALADAIEDVAALMSSRVAEKDLELIVRIDPGLSQMFVGDVGRIRQVVTNLMGNAVKFTEKGHVYVNVSPAQGDAEAGETQRIRFEVADTGIGIPEDDLVRVFDKFSQADTSASRKHEGTGLGLAITTSLIQLMQGKIGVESVVGKGSNFWFEIDLPTCEGGRMKRVPVDVSGARILVVDDNPVNRSILSEQMASWKFESVCARDGREAIAFMRECIRSEIDLECIVLDYHMPGMNGGGVVKAMHSDPELNEIPIVMLTSVDQTEDGHAFSSLGIAGHLTKPTRSSLLLETIVAVVQDSREMKQQGGRSVTPEIENARLIGRSIEALEAARDAKQLEVH
ncbi:MAG: ATP-binding protein [Pseudomonadota bacterium]